MKKLSINISVLFFLITFLSIFFNNNSTLFCQTSNLRFDHLSIKDGLPDDGYTCIIQDRLGFIWIGTTNGLSKYDGHSFVNYYRNEKDSTSLIGRNVRCLMEDSDGDIWIGTYYGLSILLRNENRIISYEHDKNDPKSLSNNWVNKIYEDKKGNIWIGTKDGWIGEKGGGLNFINRESLLDKKNGLIFQHINLDNYVEGTNTIFDILEDSENTIWACTKNGLLKISDRETELIQPIISNSYNQKNFFLSIVLDKNGLFWLGTLNNGVVSYNKNSNDFSFFLFNENSFSSITSLLLDSKDNLWVGSQGGAISSGLFLFNRTTKRYKKLLHDPLNPNSISKDYGSFRSIIEDIHGNIWFAIYDDKINKINPQRNLFKYYRNYSRIEDVILFSNETRMLEAKDGRLWFEAENGLFEFLPEEERFVKIIANNQHGDCTLDTRCRSIAEDTKGNLWIAGLDTKLREYNPNTGSLRCFDNDINLSGQNVVVIHPDRHGVMWFGTDNNGVIRYNPNTNNAISYKYILNDFSTISSNGIRRMCEDSSNTIWVATADCWLNKFNKETEQVKRMNISRDHGYFNNLFVDTKSQLWAGTNLGGIYLFNTKNDNFQRINSSHGLPSNNDATGFSEDHNGNIYCCSGSYLIKLDQEGTLENYYKIGIDDEVLHQTYYTKKTKEVFVISDKGFYRFFADSLKPNLIPPKMVLTNLKLKDKPIKVGEDSPLKTHINFAKKIELEYWQNDLTIQYAGIHYINQGENKYKYILKNYDDDWRDAGNNREVTYTNREHGEYTFKVLSSNSNGIWATEPAILSIIINPPWWLTWRAYSIYVLVFISILWNVYVVQKRRIRIRHEMEMKEFETQKLREVDQMKSEFFANISHEFRTPLTLIKGPVERLLNNDNVDDPTKIYRMIKRNSERLLNLINEILDLSKLESGKMKVRAQKSDIVSFTKAIAMSFESLAEKKEIQINITSSNNLVDLYFDKEKMQKIIANLFSNAIKFTSGRGKITVNIEEDFENQKVLIKIIDSGVGISQEELPKIFDRFYQIETSKTKGIEGTGIGLSLTKELVELHHGEITVESEMGTGTTFMLSFPLGNNHFKEDELIYTDLELMSQEDTNEEESILQSNLEDRPLLLIVEDNKDVRDFIIHIIENKYRFFEAEDGEEGFNKALKYMPDLIISDIMMPKQTGDKMCEDLKKDQITCHIPIILLTAKSLDEDRINGLECGADDYLIKPFNEKELLVRINNLIIQRRNLREKYLKEAEINPIEIAVTSLDKKFIERMIKIVEENISNTEYDVKQLADDLHVSRTQLYRKFSSVLGEKPKDFVRKYRIKRAADLIKQNYGNITAVSYKVGFDNLSYFTKCFKQVYNQSPHEYEKNCLNNKQ